MKQHCWLPQKINWIEAHLTKVMVLLGTEESLTPQKLPHLSLLRNVNLCRLAAKWGREWEEPAQSAGL